jgi:hypothetical protein
MKLTNLKYFSQADPAWKNIKLGTSTVATIGSHGCLLCDVASILTYYQKDTNPARLNDDLKRVNGFYQGSLLVYGAVTQIYPDVTIDWSNYIDCSTESAPLDKIDAILQSKRLVIVKVDFKPATSELNEHWVTIIGKTEDGSYLIMDPIDGSEQFFQARYGDPARYIFKIVVFNGTPKQEQTAEDKLLDCQTKVTSLNETVAKQALEINTLRSDLATEERDNQDLQTQINKIREEKATLTWDNAQLQTKASKLESELTDSKKTIEGLREDLARLQSASSENLTTGELFSLLLKRLLSRG